MSSWLSIAILFVAFRAARDPAALRLVVLDAGGRARAGDQVVGADAVLDQVVRDRLGRAPVPRPRARREVRVRRVDRRGRHAASSPTADGGVEPTISPFAIAVLPTGRVVEVVGRLRRRVVVQRHPRHRADRLGRDEAAVVRRGSRIDAEPALGRAVAVDVDARTAGVVDGDRESRAARDRRGRRDHELVRRALRAVLRVAAHARRAGRRVRVRRADGFRFEIACAAGSGSSGPFGSPA